LERLNEEIKYLKMERQNYEEDFKKAFMRGVCALNMEAMALFQHEHPLKDQNIQAEEASEKLGSSSTVPIDVTRLPNPTLPSSVMFSSKVDSKLGRSKDKPRETIPLPSHHPLYTFQ
jgi:centrosomal protein POC5